MNDRRTRRSLGEGWVGLWRIARKTIQFTAWHASFLMLLSTSCVGMEKEKKSPQISKRDSDVQRIENLMGTWRVKHAQNKNQISLRNISIANSTASSTTDIHNVEDKAEEVSLETKFDALSQTFDKYIKQSLDDKVNRYIKFAIVQCVILGILTTYVAVLSAIMFSR